MNRDLIYNIKIPYLVLPNVYSKSRMVLKNPYSQDITYHPQLSTTKKAGSIGT